MTERPGALPERRQHPRIEPKGTVMFHVQEHVQRGRIANISESGIYLLTSVSAPDRLLARTAELEIRIDHARAEWLRTSGRIVRIRPEGVAIAFTGAPAALRRMLDELATASHAHARVISVVLVDEDVERRTTMATGFRATGCTIIEATTPLEAIHRLGETSFEPDVIAIASSLSSDAEELREFVERDHPSVKLVRIDDAVNQPDGLIHWLSSLDPDADLPRRVRDMLFRPR